MGYVPGRDAHTGGGVEFGRALGKSGAGVATRPQIDRGSSGGGLAVIDAGARYPRPAAFLGGSDRAGSSAAILTRPRQKAVKKADPNAPAPVRARSVDGASLQLLAHEVVFLRQQLKELTDRERDVAFAVCTGGSNERMAERLCIALPTLRTHLMRLNQKLGTVRKGDIVRMMASRLLEAYRSGSLMVPPQTQNGANGATLAQSI